MTANYLHHMLSAGARAMQQQAGSREPYARMEAGADGGSDVLGPRELEFIAARDSFYMASVTEAGWPYVQHRGGPAGFIRHVEANVLGFADFSGNRQYMSAANLASDARVALIMVDYPARRRLKLIGHASRVALADDAALVAQLMPPDYSARPEAGWLLHIIAFDWNCPQHITPRWSAEQIEQMRKDNIWPQN